MIDLANDVWKIVEAYIPKTKKVTIALQLIDAFEKAGCAEIYDSVELSQAAGLGVLADFIDED